MEMRVADRVALIPVGNPNRGGPNRPIKPLRGGKPRFITVHETGNENVGANAEMHRRFTYGGGGDGRVSFHYVVDDRESIQLLPDGEAGWHSGDGSYGQGRMESVAIETCVNRDGNWRWTLERLAGVVAKLMVLYDIPIERVVQHNRWSGKNCPTKLRQAGWAELIARVGQIVATLGEQARSFPETGCTVRGAFLTYFLENGEVPRLGLPISDERQEQIGEWRGAVQWFQRARLEWHPETGGGAMLLGLVGDEALRCKRDHASG